MNMKLMYTLAFTLHMESERTNHPFHFTIIDKILLITDQV